MAVVPVGLFRDYIELSLPATTSAVGRELNDRLEECGKYTKCLM